MNTKYLLIPSFWFKTQTNFGCNFLRLNDCHKEEKQLLLFSDLLGSCNGLAPAGCQAPTKATLSLPSAAEEGRENIMRIHELRTRRDHSPNNVMGTAA